MTRHYTHVSELAAASAVNGLPAVLGDMTTPKLPPAKLINTEQIRVIVEKLNGKNWRSKRDELLAMLTPTKP